MMFMHFEEFPISKYMAPSRFYAMSETNEYFSDALDLTRYAISARLQKGLRDKTLDKDYVLRLLPIYNIDYKNLILAKVKQSQEARNEKTIVVIPEFPSSPLVPERKI